MENNNYNLIIVDFSNLLGHITEIDKVEFLEFVKNITVSTF